MYIKLTKSKTAKFTKVYLVEGFRDENGKPSNRTVHCYGNLEELQQEDPGILEKLRENAKTINLNQIQFQINFNETRKKQEADKNYGYFFLESIYEQLGISEFFNNNESIVKVRFNINEILKLLVILRAINPMSKVATYEQAKEFFKPFNVNLQNIYRSLPILNEIKESLQYCIHKEVCKHYQRDCSLVFYDVTNYYFETDYEDEFRRIGVSKENRKSPIVQMGLFIDSKGLPISYKLFSGNTNDIKTLKPILSEMRKTFEMGRVIVTADKGLNSGDNLVNLKRNGDGYIVSQKIRGAGKEFVDEILEESGYGYNAAKTFKIKSFLRKRKIKDSDGKIEELEEKVVCFWSKDYQERESHQREKLEERIQEFLDNPSKYKASNSYGIKKYLKVSHLNKMTGELENESLHLEKNQEKYDRDKSLDGYYALVTSELELSNEEIVSRYRGLWRIEESFRVLKSDLEGRPVYVRKKESIEGHFLVCFLSLLIMRILEIKLENKYSITKIQESLRKATCRPLEQGIYSLNKDSTEVISELSSLYQVSLDKRFYKSEELRKIHKKLLQYPT